jgi:hypothetical protein
LAIPPQSPDAIFDQIYSRLPADLIDQRDAMRQAGP